MRSSWLPSVQTASKLFVTGATVGPIVDSLHNQCLLEYDFLPIHVSTIFSSSWTVPPLLGVAYVVLGGILPRLAQLILPDSTNDPPNQTQFLMDLKTKAYVAVLSTAFIIKCSEFLETNDSMVASLDANANIALLLGAALTQWYLLDGTLSALLVASVTSIGGPLSELPFVANHIWHYLPQAADYMPLANFDVNTVINTDSSFLSIVLEGLLGKDYQDLALSSITGPCYFAVTMDAIALGRWFDEDEH